MILSLLQHTLPNCLNTVSAMVSRIGLLPMPLDFSSHEELWPRLVLLRNTRVLLIQMAVTHLPRKSMMLNDPSKCSLMLVWERLRLEAECLVLSRVLAMVVFIFPILRIDSLDMILKAKHWMQTLWKSTSLVDMLARYTVLFHMKLILVHGFSWGRWRGKV